MANIDDFHNNRLAIFLHATGYTVILTALFAGGGYALDQLIGTFPTFFIIGIVIGYPITQLILFKKSRELANKLSKKKK